MDMEARSAAVHEVSKSWTWLKDWTELTVLMNNYIFQSYVILAAWVYSALWKIMLNFPPCTCAPFRSLNIHSSSAFLSLPDPQLKYQSVVLWLRTQYQLYRENLELLIKGTRGLPSALLNTAIYISLSTKTWLPHLEWEGHQWSRIGVLCSPVGTWDSLHNQTQGHGITVWNYTMGPSTVCTKICLVPWNEDILIGPRAHTFLFPSVTEAGRWGEGQEKPESSCFVVWFPSAGHAFSPQITVSDFPKYWWRWIPL